MLGCFAPYPWPLAATVEVFSHTSSTFNELNEHCASSPVKLFACATNDHSLHSSPLIATIIVCVTISQKGMTWRSGRDCSWIMIYNAYTVHPLQPMPLVPVKSDCFHEANFYSVSKTLDAPHFDQCPVYTVLLKCKKLTVLGITGNRMSQREIKYVSWKNNSCPS